MFEAKQTNKEDVIIAAVNHSLARFRYRNDVRPKIHYVMEGTTYWQVIAWLVRPDGSVTPITVEGVQSISNDEAWAIVTPNGMFIEPDVGSWKTSHDWYLTVLDRWQQRTAAVAA